jgi:hypothetical protein
VGSPDLSATNSFTVVVLPGVSLTAPKLGANGYALRIPTLLGSQYEVLFSTNLVDWASVSTVSGDGSTHEFLTPETATIPVGFYRIQLKP